MMVQILLIRHAAHIEVGKILTGRGADIPLSVEGEAQARRLAQALVGTPVTAIYSSPQRRCRETAAILASSLGLSVQIDDSLNEIDFGDWTGKSFPELEQDPLWVHWNYARSEASPPGGESMTEAVRRVADFIGQLDAGPSRAILCVTHADIIRGVIAHNLGLGLDNILRFDIDPASISALQIGRGWTKLTTLNRIYA